MAEPKIDPTWNCKRESRLLIWIIPGLVFGVALVFSFFKQCNGLGKEARQSVYENGAEGFVAKTNLLLEHLLADVDSTITAKDLASLNRHYPALEFALPYAEEGKEVIYGTDLRLVGIHPERIKDEDDRTFYYNSNLPQMLRQQKEKLHETFFSIKCKSLGYNAKEKVRPFEIKSIRVVKSMFKVALEKDPWNGILYGRESCLFPSTEYIFLTYGDCMLPMLKINHLKIPSGYTPYSFHANVKSQTILQNDKQTVDYYNVYKQKSDAISIILKDNKRTTLACTKDSVHIMIDDGLKAYQFEDKKGMVEINAIVNAAHSGKHVAMTDGMKIAVFDSENNKLAEFCLHKNDPTRCLSRLVKTSKGDARYTISKNQTDLFTQQVIRGITRNLSNKQGCDSVCLSLDPMLSHEFEREIINYLTSVRRTIDSTTPVNQKKVGYDISLTIMDMATGEVLASPFYTTEFDKKDYPEALKMTYRNPSLKRRYLGSTFKPILALAAVQSNPNLLNLDTHNKCQVLSKENKEAMFYSHKVGLWAGETSHWKGTDFAHFLAHSDDVYPVALAAWALTGKSVPSAIQLPTDGSKNYFTKKNGTLCLDGSKISPSNMPFFHWLSHLGGTTNYTSNSDDDWQDMMTDDIFRNLPNRENQDNFGLDDIAPDAVNLHCETFNKEEKFRQCLVPWVLGQGSNEWSPIQIAQAWCRMLTMHNVYASYIQQGTRLFGKLYAGDKPASNGGERDSVAVRTTWVDFLGKFQSAQSLVDDGRANTLKPVFDAVKQVNSGNLMVFGKTGTPDAVELYEMPMLGGNGRYYDIGLYTFGVMTPTQYTRVKRGEHPHGIVCVMRITRTYVCNRCRSDKCGSCKKYNGMQSTHARKFFTQPNMLQKLYDMTKSYFGQ